MTTNGRQSHRRRRRSMETTGSSLPPQKEIEWTPPPPLTSSKANTTSRQREVEWAPSSKATTTKTTTRTTEGPRIKQPLCKTKSKSHSTNSTSSSTKEADESSSSERRHHHHRHVLNSMDLTVDTEGFLVPRRKLADNVDEEDTVQPEEDSISVPYCKLLQDDNHNGKSTSTLTTEALTRLTLDDSGIVTHEEDNFLFPREQEFQVEDLFARHQQQQDIDDAFALSQNDFFHRSKDDLSLLETPQPNAPVKKVSIAKMDLISPLPNTPSTSCRRRGTRRPPDRNPSLDSTVVNSAVMELSPVPKPKSVPNFVIPGITGQGRTLQDSSGSIDSGILLPSPKPSPKPPTPTTSSRRRKTIDFAPLNRSSRLHPSSPNKGRRRASDPSGPERTTRAKSQEPKRSGRGDRPSSSPVKQSSRRVLHKTYDDVRPPTPVKRRSRLGARNPLNASKQHKENNHSHPQTPSLRTATTRSSHSLSDHLKSTPLPFPIQHSLSPSGHESREVVSAPTPSSDHMKDTPVVGKGRKKALLTDLSQPPTDYNEDESAAGAVIVQTRRVPKHRALRRRSCN